MSQKVSHELDYAGVALFSSRNMRRGMVRADSVKNLAFRSTLGGILSEIGIFRQRGSSTS